MFSMMTFVKSIYFCLECGAGAYIWSLDHDSRNPRAKVCGESSNHWTFQLQKPAGPALCAGKLHRVLIPSFPICFSMLFWRVQFMIRRVCVYKSRSWGCGCMQYMVCFEAKADIGRSCWLVRFSWSSCSRWRKSTPLSVDTDAGGLLLIIQVFFWILQVLLAFHIVFGWLYVSIMDISL